MAPAFANIAEAIEDLNTIRDRPSGIVRLNVPRMAAHMVLAPAFGRFNQAYPDVHLEVAVEEAFTDIVARGFDAGVRLGESVQRDMIAVRITPDLRIAIVCSPDYLAGRFVPDSPRDLREHACIGYRQPASGARYRWEFARDGQEIEVAVEGPLTLDDPDLMIAAALDGLGLAYAMEGRVTEHLSSGRLVRVLTDWCPPFPGFFLYYPSRRQMPAALRALIDFLRVAEPDDVRKS